MNTIDISYDNNSYKDLASRKTVVDYLNLVLAELGLSDVEFSVSFIGEDRMHQLNMEFRSIDDSTDILSFVAEDDDGFGFITAGTRNRVLGDMLICPEVLKRNAMAFNVSEKEELRRLLIHGVLHLSGENHMTNDPSEPMLIKQEEILRNLS